jgi:hypothetical protein
MNNWSDWLNQHWYQIGVLIGLALIVMHTARTAYHAAVASSHLSSIKNDLSHLWSEVEKWHLSWRVSDDQREMDRRSRF